MLQPARQPRVHITYATTDGEDRELPFVVGVLADFCGDAVRPPPYLHERKFVQIDQDNFNEVMARMSPGLELRVRNTLLDDDSEIPIRLAFDGIADFSPGRVVDQVEPLNRLRLVRSRLRDLIAVVNRPAGRAPVADTEKGTTGEPAAPPLRALVAVNALPSLEQRANPLDPFLATASTSRALALWFGADDPVLAAESRADLAASIDQDIAMLDGLIAQQVDAIIHHPRFQRLEAAWRGIQYLVVQAEREEGVVFRIIHWTWPELCRDMERALEFDRSELFNKVYNEAFGMPGGEPFGVLIGDYAVQHRPSASHRTSDVDALQGIAQVAAAAFVPFIVGCEPYLLGLEDFSRLGMRLDLSSLLQQPDYIRWRRFQETADARFIAVTLPRVLMRLPYTDDGTRDDGFRYRETVEMSRGGDYLWGNAGYAFAAVLVREFVLHGWFADIRGVRQMSGDDAPDFNGGMVHNLPVQSFATDREGVAIKFSMEVSLSEQAERELASLGLLPIMDCKNTPWAAFRSAQSVQRPAQYTSAVATTNARLSAMLQHIFCISRFSHYVKVIMRDRVGAFTTAEECERFLGRWLMDYYTTNIDASLSEKARYPLQEASVTVREVPEQPGSYACTMYFCPHFQPADVVSTFHMVTELANSATTAPA